MRPKLISLDVWNTLIVADPEFAAARDRFFAAELPRPIDEVRAVYRRLKTDADAQAESCGAGPTSAAVFQRLCAELDLPEHFDWWRVRHGFEMVVAAHPPKALPETVTALRAVQAAGIHLSIGSNTNFIRGQVLNDVALGSWGVAWAFQVFSDEIECSKPHPDFWRCIRDSALPLGVAGYEILHIGDNPACDGGAAAHGLGYRHIPDHTALPAVLTDILA